MLPIIFFLNVTFGQCMALFTVRFGMPLAPPPNPTPHPPIPPLPLSKEKWATVKAAMHLSRDQLLYLEKFSIIYCLFVNLY